MELYTVVPRTKYSDKIFHAHIFQITFIGFSSVDLSLVKRQVHEQEQGSELVFMATIFSLLQNLPKCRRYKGSYEPQIVA